MSILLAVSEIRKYCRHHSVDPRDATQSLKRVSTSILDYDSGLRLISDFNLPDYPLVPQHVFFFRVIDWLVRRFMPVVFQYLIYGKDRVFRELGENQLQCLRDAHMLGDELDPEVDKWWQSLSVEMRLISEEQKRSLGREGELLSLAFERSRLAKIGILDKYPRLVAMNDDTRGYDLESYDLVAGSVVGILIEVKTIAGSHGFFYITKKEWETSLENRDRYRFHLWKLGIRDTPIAMSVDEIEGHVPKDRGQGSWRVTRIPSLAIEHLDVRPS